MYNKTSKDDYNGWSQSDLIKEIGKLKKRKKYGLVWDEERVKEVFEEQVQEKLPILKEVIRNRITDKSKTNNILIEGDNYHALSVLNYTHKEKIDVIYIDPPFNTGSRDWKYNNNYINKDDSFKHSKWLSFISKRLKLAKKLLKNNGVLICAIDENELFNLGCLIEDIFYNYEKHLITIIHNPRGVQGNNFSYVNEFVFFIFKKGQKLIGKLELDEPQTSNFRNWGGESLRTDAKNCFYPILVKKNKIVGFGDVLSEDVHPINRVIIDHDIKSIYPIDPQNIERKWRYARQTVEEIKSNLIVKNDEIFIQKTLGSIKTVWQKKKYDSSIYGTQLINTIINNNNFSYPKSLWLVQDCIKAIARNRKNSVILDFFAGSGTTGHAVLELNKEDKGSRKFILCTNNENNICTNICHPRLKKIIKGYTNSKGKKIEGLGGNFKYFKTSFVNSEPTDQNKKIMVKQSTEMICLKEDCFELVTEGKQFKIFKNYDDKYLGIIYYKGDIKSFKTKVKNLNKKINTYVFSFTDETNAEEFEDIKSLITLKPIPSSILNVYQRIFAYVKTTKLSRKSHK